MARGRGKGEDYPTQVVTKRGIVELRMSPASMHELLTQALRMTSRQVADLARQQITQHPRRETFWSLVAYVALSSDSGAPPPAELR